MKWTYEEVAYMSAEEFSENWENGSIQSSMLELLGAEKQIDEKSQQEKI